ncbi:hypothetical protein ACM61V_08365 [Sphingomonas sp. TX0543]|uniref:hypothetical protein n=1 Tax=unclassified Sphingomonas TaxID=196159 RepID=UPI0010F7BD6E|nr:hypothetical protein [Sphingomonas sp. 3P27F8]
MLTKGHDVAEPRRLDVAHHRPAQPDQGLMRDLGGAGSLRVPRTATSTTRTGRGEILRIIARSLDEATPALRALDEPGELAVRA